MIEYTTQNMEIIRIAIAEDHEIVRNGIVRLLNEVANFEIVGEFEQGQALIDALEAMKPDVLILDVDMPVLDGIEVLKRIRSDYPSIKTVMLTMHETPEFIAKLVALGTNGYLPKNSGFDELVLAINTVFETGRYFNERVAKALFENLTKIVPPSDLTDREKDIIRLVCDGKTNREIAETLNLSFRTIEVHRKNINRKINTTNVQGVIKYAVEHGIYTYT